MKKVLIARDWASGHFHGGALRSLQIEEMLAEKDVDYETLPPRVTASYTLDGICAAILLKRRIPSIDLIDMLRIVRRYSPALVELRKYRGDKVVLWESTRSYYWPLACKKLGIDVIALPHNLESVNFRLNFSYIKTEIACMKYLSRAVFAISSEDAWMFNQGSGSVDWLPYSPPKEIMLRSEKIRKSRKAKKTHNNDDRILILGTSQKSNEHDLVELVLAADKLGIAVDVVGKGNETILRKFNLRNTIVHGYVDDIILQSMLINCRCALVWNRTGSGVLTRIPELALCGIPVICNVGAARSAYFWPNVYIAKDIIEACATAHNSTRFACEYIDWLNNSKGRILGQNADKLKNAINNVG